MKDHAPDDLPQLDRDNTKASDQLLVEAVETALRAAPTLHVDRVHVSATDGVVYLRGLTSNQWQIAAIDRRVKQTTGDNAVLNLLRLWSVEAIQSALAQDDPALAGEVIVVGIARDPTSGERVAIIWSMEDKEVVGRVVEAVAPGMATTVHTGLAHAVVLGVPQEQWQPIWQRHRRPRNVVMVHDESEYLGAAVAQARQQHIDTSKQVTELLPELRKLVVDPINAELVYSVIALLAEQAEQIVQKVHDLTEGTRLSESQNEMTRSAILQRYTFGYARGLIEHNREEWEKAGVFDQLVVLAIEMMFEAEPVFTAFLAKDWQGEESLGPTIATAGMVLANMRNNGRLTRSLRAAAAGANSARTKNELVVASLGSILAKKLHPVPGKTIREYIDTLVKEVEREVTAEELELDTQTTIPNPNTGKPVAVNKFVSLGPGTGKRTAVKRDVLPDDPDAVAEVAPSPFRPSPTVAEGDSPLENDRLGLFNPHEEVVAVHRVLEQADQEEALWLEAKLSRRELAIKQLSRVCYEPQDIAKLIHEGKVPAFPPPVGECGPEEIAASLKKTANQVSVLKNRADRKIARVEEQRRAIGN